MFRSEVARSARDRLSGDLQVAVPLPWLAVAYLLVSALIAAIAFFALATYSRVETVTGTITPDKGVSRVVPTRVGTIEDLSIHNGQSVTAGAPLAEIRAEEASAAGPSAEARIAAAVGQQDASLAAQIVANDNAAQAQIRQVAAQRIGLTGEISQLQSQITFQRDLIATAQADYNRANKIAERGFLSQRDLQAREDALVARQQALAQLTQALANKQAALAQAERSGVQITSQTKAENASLTASRAEVAQQAAITSGSRSYALRAPIAGTVTALTARVGEVASPQVALLSIVPDGSVFQAELAVPSTAIGFVKPGQSVRLAIDAFPYQNFGTIEGHILTVATSAITTQTANGIATRVYPVRVRLDQQYVLAYGRREPLISEMTLTARIVTQRESLLEWLFEPLFAVRRR